MQKEREVIMICDENLRKFIRDIADTDDTFEVVPHAFAFIVEQYRICRLKAAFLAPVTYCFFDEKRKDLVLYEQPDKKGYLTYHVEYQTKGDGKVIFEVFQEKDVPPFTEEEKKDIKTILDIIYMHCLKWKLVKLAREIGQTDSLTGLPNSVGFHAHLDEVIKKNELCRYNAFYFNLVRFGLINNRYGVKETNQIITRYAARIVGFLQNEECLGRLGGDNFVALIRKERTEEFLNIISGVETYGLLDGKEEPITIGAVAGIVDINENNTDSANIVSDCSMAMNIAKHIRKEPYAYATLEIKEKRLKSSQMITNFSKAIQNKEFMAFYQPKVSIDNYMIVGAEALVRWKQDQTFVSPGEFIPEFEQNGMICELDFYILEQVCMDIRQWLAMGIEPIRISVNFSRRHLSNPNLAEDIMRIIKKYDIDSKYIEIELTETVDEEEAGLLISFMNKMRKYQILMTIDDFGTGFASLNMLRSFPVDVLKIDKSLVDNMEENDHIILSNVVKMASELDMDVVAEGVETWEQVDYLKTVNCSVVQGFLFDRPMPKEQFEEKLKLGKYEVG